MGDIGRRTEHNASRSFIISSVAVTAIFVAAVWFGTKPAAAFHPPGSHASDPVPDARLKVERSKNDVQTAAGTAAAIPTRVILKTIPTVAQFNRCRTDAFHTTPHPKHDDEVSIRTTKTIPVSRIR